MGNLQLLFGGNPDFRLVIVSHPFAQFFQNGVRAAPARADDENISEPFLILTVEVPQLRQRSLRSVTRRRLFLARPMMISALADFRMSRKRLLPIPRPQVPPDAVTRGEHFFGVRERMRGHLRGPSGRATTLQKIGLFESDHAGISPALISSGNGISVSVP
jgi:hypothetical protein